MDQSFEPVSLGQACEVKFQISRHLFTRAHPQGSQDFLRYALRTKRASPFFISNVFDSQLTPTSALLTYLEQDFEGVYEREDIVPCAMGGVENRRFKVWMPHDFRPVDGVVDDAVIDQQYPAARARFEHLAARFRDKLARPGPYLYIRGDSPTPWIARRLIDLLSARSSEHRFRILFFDRTPPNFDLRDVDERILQDIAPGAEHKLPDQEWEGNDQAWDRILSPFNLTMPGRPRFTARFNRIEDFSSSRLEPVSLEWSLLPQTPPSRAVPLTFDVPDIAWAFAALSEQVEGLARTTPQTLVVTLEVLAGQVGAALVRADGTALIGNEYWIAPEDCIIKISLPLTPDMGPARVVLRNYNHSGSPGSVRVHRVELAH